MAVDWIERFKAWAKPPSETEEEKASTAARMINQAVRETKILDGRRFAVYPTGSYRNNTNVRAGSDVDVAVVLEDAFWYTLPAGVTAQQLGLGVRMADGLDEFRRDLRRALEQKFGRDVTCANKTFDIAGNSNRLPADVTPFLLHREYTGRRLSDGSWEFRLGVETRPGSDPSRRIVNWHQEHYDNGVKRNSATNRRFKRVTRILKRMRADMLQSRSLEKTSAAESVSSFLLECLVYNAPDSCFNKQDGSYHLDVKAVIEHLSNETKDDARAAKLVEVNEVKRLFGPHQRWTRFQAHDFLLHAWQYAELKR